MCYLECLGHLTASGPSSGCGGKAAGRRVQTSGLTLLGHSRLFLRPKPAVSRGKMLGVNLASEKEWTNYLIRRAV